MNASRAVADHTRERITCCTSATTRAFLPALPRTLVILRRLLFPLLLFTVGAPSRAVLAQGSTATASATSRGAWRATAEVGGVFGGTWLEGLSAPTVSTDAGATIGVGLKRRVADRVTVGAALSVGSQAISLAEGGTQWSGGTLTEANLQGVLSFLTSQGTPLRPSLDLSAGLTVLSGARDVAPFRDASRIAPLGEIGLTVRRLEHRVDRQEYALFARYGAVRMRGSATAVPLTSANAARGSDGAGWVGRWRAGLQVTR